MAQLAVLPGFNIHDFIFLAGDKLVTDSRKVADAFGKMHKNVLRAHDNLDCPDEFLKLNFEPVDYIDKNGETRRSVQMTKDGFMFLVMGVFA